MHCALLFTAATALAAETYVPDGSFAGPGADLGQFTDPGRASVEQSTGNLFVADKGNGEVDVFKPNGEHLTSFGSAQLDAPYGIAIAESGGQTMIYVSDGSVGKVQRFESDEATTPAFTLDGAYAGPVDVGDYAAPLALAPNGDLWLADRGDDKVQRYSPAGTLLSTIDGAGSPGGAFTGLVDLAVDSQGRVYAIDSDGTIENQPDGSGATGQSRVERFAPDGTHQLSLAGLNRPATVAVDPATDEVAVSADQTAVDGDQAPSLHVFDPAGAELHSTRMGEAAKWSTVHGLAFESATPRIWSVNDAGYYGVDPYGQEGIHRFARIELPTAAIEAPEDVTQTRAVFKATLELKGNTTQARFEVSSDSGESWSSVGEATACEVAVAGDCEGSTLVSFNAPGWSLQPATPYEVRVRGVVGGSPGDPSPTTESFTTAAPLTPIVSIDNASEVSYISAKASGTVDAGGSDILQETNCRFDYVTQAQFEVDGFDQAEPNGQSVPCDPNPLTGSGDIPVAAELTGLKPARTYHLRLLASNNAGLSETAVAASTFETLPVAPPSVALDPVSGISGEAASFAGTIDPEAPSGNFAAFDVSWRFQCTPACPGTPAPQTIPADSDPHPVSFDAAGLEPNTAYEVKLIASNAGGEAVQSQSFETAAMAPTLAAGTVGALSTDSARLTAYVDANNTPTTATFEYDTDGSFTSPTTAPTGPGATVAGNGSAIAYADIAGLDPETTYHWRVSVESTEGADSEVAPRAFQTWPTPPKGDGVGAFGDRAIEQISPRGEVGAKWGKARLSEDATKVLLIPSPGSDQSEFEEGAIVATRGERGWMSTGIQPPPLAIGTPRVMLRAWSPDMTRFFSVGNSRIEASNSPLRHFYTSPGGTDLEWASTLPATVGAGFLVIADDLSMIATAPRMPLVPEDPSPGGLYDISGPEPQLIGFLPNGEAPLCGVGGPAGQGETPETVRSNVTQNWVSDSGERVFFHTRGNDCAAPQQLYMREGGASGETRLISGPVLSGPATTARFLRSTPDGSQVFFTSSSVLDPADLDEDLDVYRYVIGVGNACLTCGLDDPRINAPSGLEPPGEIFVAEDGSRLYFTSSRSLSTGLAGGSTNLYVWRASEPDEVHLVAPSKGIETTGGPSIIASKSGAVVVLSSGRDELDTLTNSDNGKGNAYYRYDDRDGTLACISCTPAGVESKGAGFFAGEAYGGVPRGSTGIAKDGDMFVFNSSDALVPEDDNEAQDVYEWREGALGLVSDGRNDSPANLYDLSTDGGSVLIEGRLKPTADSPESESAIIVARVGGGFPEVPPPVVCAGDGCRAAPSQPPVASEVGSSQFSGPGNPTAKPPKRCPKGKVKRGKRCVKTKGNKAGKQQGKRAGVKRGGSK